MASLYASVGETLTHYHLDADQGTLVRKASVSCPHEIHYAWPHVSGKYLYVGSSDAPPGAPGSVHHLTAFKVGAEGALSPHDQMALPLRPVHLSTDIPSTHVLVAFNRPSVVKVYDIKPDGRLGGELEQPVDAGIFAHQVRVTPDNRMAVVVTRGNHPANGKPEDPGALKIFKYDNGRLSDCATVAPNDGYGFGARHADFHPTAPWVYVSIERQQQMIVFRREGDAILPQPVCVRSTLREPEKMKHPDYPHQMAGTVHVHPKGHVVYGVNRAFTPETVNGRKVLTEGQNSIVVYRIDQASGDITAIQHEDTRGVYPRTFHVDPSGRILVAAHRQAMDVLVGGQVKTLAASLALFRIAADGTLQYLRQYDVDVGGKPMQWMAIFP